MCGDFLINVTEMEEVGCLVLGRSYEMCGDFFINVTEMEEVDCLVLGRSCCRNEKCYIFITGITLNKIGDILLTLVEWLIITV